MVSTNQEEVSKKGERGSTIIMKERDPFFHNHQSTITMLIIKQTSLLFFPINQKRSQQVTQDELKNSILNPESQVPHTIS